MKERVKERKREREGEKEGKRERKKERERERETERERERDSAAILTSCSPEHFVPVLAHKVYLVARDIQVAADALHLLEFLLGMAHATLIALIPILHKHPFHLQS